MSNFKDNSNFITKGKVPVFAWNDNLEIEKEALEQLKVLSEMPFIHQHIAVMPDVHAGIGATVGSVIPTKGAIIPAAVGVDLGCGMMAAQTNILAEHLPDNLSKIRFRIEEKIPHGRTSTSLENDKGAWNEIPDFVIQSFQNKHSNQLKDICEKHPSLAPFFKRATHHLGTLGGGNHFVEVCLDESNKVWVMLHSGSRGIGNKIGTYFIEKAKKEMERWFINLKDENLAYLSEGSLYFNDYVEAVGWAQDYALTNRELMMHYALSALEETLGYKIQITKQAINCHHNYVEKENHFNENVWVTRKGAIRAREGDLGIIPGSMGAKSFIVKGKGNKKSFDSCSHGAGRIMSRTQAKKTFTIEDHSKATEGVECRKDFDVLDETPCAYKDIEKVMAAQTDLVEIIHTLKQVICVKG